MVVEVAAPSRLHFGLFSFGRSDARQFGGAGVMIERPGLTLRIVPADRFEARGPLAERAVRVAGRVAERLQLDALPNCRIELLEVPPQHVGLGTGTQLSLAVAAGLNAYLERSPLDAGTLAELAGRGARSAIGTHGFLRGGFLVESGKSRPEELSPLEQHVILPEAWRFVLICQAEQPGLAGEDEQRAFRELPAVPESTTRALRQEVHEVMVPAARAGAFREFSSSLYRFGHLAGSCFAARQGGAFAGPAIANLVSRIRALGVEGVGQSSWGPTVFALTADGQSAEQLAAALSKQLNPRDTMMITPASGRGATITKV